MIFLEHDHRHAAAPQDNAAIAGTHTSPKPKLKSKAKNKTARTPHAPHAFTQANNQRYHALLGKAIKESVHQLERLLIRRVLGQAVHFTCGEPIATTVSVRSAHATATNASHMDNTPASPDSDLHCTPVLCCKLKVEQSADLFKPCWQTYTLLE